MHWIGTLLCFVVWGVGTVMSAWAQPQPYAHFDAARQLDQEAARERAMQTVRSLKGAALQKQATVAGISATFTVNSTGDAGDSNVGDGLCRTDAAAECTLRAAIEEANATTAADLIAFNIPGGVHTIEPEEDLPAITFPVTIDGYTQPGVAPATAESPALLRIILQGPDSDLFSFSVGLSITSEAHGSIIRGLVIGNFTDGLFIMADDVRIEGNHIGTDATGTMAFKNLRGVVIRESTGSLIGGVRQEARNVISGCVQAGIFLHARARDTRIQGNFIGTDAAGKTAISIWSEDSTKSEEGISFFGERTGFAKGTQVGGLEPGARNIISGNYVAISFVGPSSIEDRVSKTVIQGNYIGTDVTGTQELGNPGLAIYVGGAEEVLIGGTIPAARNIIAGSGGGIRIRASNNTVQGNYIGTDFTGTRLLPNRQSGIHLERGSTGNILGGEVEAAGNVVAGAEQYGILLGGSADAPVSNNLIQGNYIGTDATGTQLLGNARHGIYLSGYALDNVIGGEATGAGNLIAGNGDAGIHIANGASRNRVLSNKIYNNVGLGIDLGTRGVDPNDPGDINQGANNPQNYPGLMGTLGPQGLAVTGTIQSTANTTFRVELFGNVEADPSGYGEGERLLWVGDVTTEGSTGIFTAVFPLNKERFITATATDPDGNTSEFSAAFRIPPNVVTPEDTSVVEAADLLILAVHLKAPSTVPIQVDYQTQDSTATSVGEHPDYKAIQGTLEFVPGEQEKSIIIELYDDFIPEEDDAFLLMFSNPVNTDLAADRVTIRLLNDDIPLEAPQLLDPADNAQGVPTSLFVEWEPVENAVHYFVQVTKVGGDYGPGALFYEAKTEETRLEVSSMQQGKQYGWRVRAAGSTGEGLWSEERTFTTGTGVDREDAERPLTLALRAVHPHPFFNQATVSIEIPTLMEVRVVVYDLLGRQVEMLVNKPFAPGRHTLTWEASHLPAGTYLLRLETPDRTLTHQVLHLR